MGRSDAGDGRFPDGSVKAKKKVVTVSLQPERGLGRMDRDGGE
jgi:predicted Rdx family selenoprotein